MRVSLTKSESVKLPLNYKRAKFAMTTARWPDRGKPLENNTRLFKRNPVSHPVNNNKVEPYAVQLHSTDVVTIFPDGVYQLRSGGWETRITRDRINRYSPAKTFTRDNIMYVRIPIEYIDDDDYEGDRPNYYRNEKARVTFSTKMLVSPDGRPYRTDSKNYQGDIRSIKRKLDKEVNDYVETMANLISNHEIDFAPVMSHEASACNQCLRLFDDNSRQLSVGHLVHHVMNDEYSGTLFLAAHAEYNCGAQYKGKNMDRKKAYEDFKERSTLGIAKTLVERSLKNFFRDRKSKMAKEIKATRQANEKAQS